MGTRGESPPGHEVVRGAGDLAGTTVGAGPTGLIAVTAGDADAWLGQHRSLVSSAAGVSVVSLGEQVRSTAARSGGTATVPDIKGVPDAGDLAVFGRHVTETIAAYEDQGLRPVVVLDAIPALIDATGLEATFRAVHLLSARARKANGRLVTVLPETLDADAADTLGALAD